MVCAYYAYMRIGLQSRFEASMDHGSNHPQLKYRGRSELAGGLKINMRTFITFKIPTHF